MTVALASITERHAPLVPTRKWMSTDWELVQRCWEDECVVYHTGSADTHLLNATAMTLLEFLGEHPEGACSQTCAEALASAYAVSLNEELLDQTQKLLAELEELGLVDSVP